jgi:hypothetical protein
MQLPADQLFPDATTQKGRLGAFLIYLSIMLIGYYLKKVHLANIHESKMHPAFSFVANSRE